MAQTGEEPMQGQLLSYYGAFDTSADTQTQQTMVRDIQSGLKTMFKETRGTGFSYSVESPESSREDFLTLYGGLFFLGMFLGVLFIMATVLIIYYKQISEGYDDKERFAIMQKVGMSRSEVRKSIHSQVLTVFFLPLAAAGIHLAFAFKLITRLLTVLSLFNTWLFAVCLVGAFILFGVFYCIVYALTAKTYYKIVER